MQVSTIAHNTVTREMRIDMMTRVSSAGIRLDLNGDTEIVSLLMSPDEAMLLINRLSSALINNR